MAHPLVTLALLVMGLILSLFHAYNLHSESIASLSNPSATPPLEFPSPRNHSSRSEDVPSDTPSSIFYFLQISDLHISTHVSKGGLAHLKVFLDHVLPNFPAAALVLVSGDLTDAKDKWKLGSGQIQAEWNLYHDTLSSYGISLPQKQGNVITHSPIDNLEKSIPWLDMVTNPATQ